MSKERLTIEATIKMEKSDISPKLLALSYKCLIQKEALELGKVNLGCQTGIGGLGMAKQGILGPLIGCLVALCQQPLSRESGVGI